MCRSQGGVGKGRVALQLLDHLLVFLVGLHGGNAEALDLYAAIITPLGAELFLQGLCQLLGVAHHCRIADAHGRDPCKGRLQSREQLALELAVDLHAVIALGEIAADIGVEQQRIDYLVAVFSKAANADVDVDAGPFVHHTEGDGRRSAVLVADELLGVEIVHPLILGRLAAEGETLADGLEGVPNALSQRAGKNAGLCGGVIGKFTRLRADLHDLALLHDEHALSVRYGDDRAVGNDVIASLGVGGAAGLPLLSLDRNGVGRNCLAVEILLPLICQNAAQRADARFNKSHSFTPFVIGVVPRKSRFSVFPQGEP